MKALTVEHYDVSTNYLKNTSDNKNTMLFHMAASKHYELSIPEEAAETLRKSRTIKGSSVLPLEEPLRILCRTL